LLSVLGFERVSGDADATPHDRKTFIFKKLKAATRPVSVFATSLQGCGGGTQGGVIAAKGRKHKEWRGIFADGSRGLPSGNKVAKTAGIKMD
jgi:hypothetical protein